MTLTNQRNIKERQRTISNLKSHLPYNQQICCVGKAGSSSTILSCLQKVVRIEEETRQQNSRPRLRVQEDDCDRKIAFSNAISSVKGDRQVTAATL
jgi:thiamine monophosphate kinase